MAFGYDPNCRRSSSRPNTALLLSPVSHNKRKLLHTHRAHNNNILVINLKAIIASYCSKNPNLITGIEFKIYLICTFAVANIVNVLFMTKLVYKNY